MAATVVRSAAPCSLRTSGQGAGSTPPGGQSLGTLYGHAAVFNVWTRIDSSYENGGLPFLERISAGAFTASLVSDRAQIRVQFQHGQDPQAGPRPLGPLTTVREDSIGLYYECPLADTGFNRNELVPLLQSGALRDASFRFLVEMSDVVDNPGPSQWNVDGIMERTIRRARVIELGPVVVGAYQQASSAVK